ncbi:MAG: aminoacyl-tRNA hydrolase [Lachnospiraceae bacterium]|jgi:PTH1 family peptidyl-tRNA hydrolase|nr:aminoacyl-tRNA hydrolase [Lachnospiraceae bacterium]
MFVIVGLGNPSKEYENTRHNIGFDTIDAIADKYHIQVAELKHKAKIGKGYIGGDKVILAKPLTFMNLSGESVRAIIDYYKVDVETELVVISDDISLLPGQLRIRKRGSAGGHNGLKNIIQHVGGDNFQRIRMGVGEKPKEYDLVDWVLGHFNKEDRKAVDEAIQKAVQAVEIILTDGADAAMNEFNRKVQS